MAAAGAVRRFLWFGLLDEIEQEKIDRIVEMRNTVSPLTVCRAGRSVAARWYYPDRLPELALSVFNDGTLFIAPDFMAIEVANVLWKVTRAGPLRADMADQAMQRLQIGPVAFRPTFPLIAPALAAAHQLDHPVYDALYIYIIHIHSPRRSGKCGDRDRRSAPRCCRSKMASHRQREGTSLGQQLLGARGRSKP